MLLYHGKKEKKNVLTISSYTGASLENSGIEYSGSLIRCVRVSCPKKWLGFLGRLEFCGVEKKTKAFGDVL